MTGHISLYLRHFSENVISWFFVLVIFNKVSCKTLYWLQILICIDGILYGWRHDYNCPVIAYNNNTFYYASLSSHVILFIALFSIFSHASHQLAVHHPIIWYIKWVKYVERRNIASTIYLDKNVNDQIPATLIFVIQYLPTLMMLPC